ncbi:MAG TPA: hypothetical protein VK778_06840 [Solirubrobacteraceae bacterium]|jgi:hypothetical protein|nr:hypothetical protein [Solirubrobacteraceae bacterium]
MSKRKSMSDEQLYALIRESRPPDESFPPSAAETEGDRVLSQILASDRSETEQPRAKRRRRMVRTGALSVGAALVLSGSALAAGSALGVIELGGGDTAEALTSVPTPYTSNGKTYEINAKPGTAYAYRLVGGVPPSRMRCADPQLTVESNRQLSKEELHKILLEESEGPTRVGSDLLPPGVESVGWGCVGARPAASPSTQAEAEAEGWNRDKWRELSPRIAGHG